MFLGLNPSFSHNDLTAAEVTELTLIKIASGISHQVFKNGEMFYSDRPRAESLFNTQTDNFTPIFNIRNCIIIRLLDSEGTSVGLLQVVNREPFLELQDYKNTVKMIAENLSNIITVCSNNFKYTRLVGTLKEQLGDMRMILNAS